MLINCLNWWSFLDVLEKSKKSKKKNSDFVLFLLRHFSAFERISY